MTKWTLCCAVAVMWLLHSPCRRPHAVNRQLLPTRLRLNNKESLTRLPRPGKAVIRRNPSDAAANASLGVVLSKEQKYKEAAAAYEKALALNPNLPGMQLNLGLAEFKQGRFQAAIGPLRAASVADSQNRQAATLLGLSYYGAKHFAEAAKYLEPAAKAI